jgi:dTDP-4-dehydrorhamnose 3,5-epimerase
MVIESIKNLLIPDVKVLRYQRKLDERGYFSETLNIADFKSEADHDFLKTFAFVQSNESYSKKNVFRGLHFQTHPKMGKLIRCISGHMIDFSLDVRKDSLTFGKIVAYDMPAHADRSFGEWIWVPSGFAHGSLFLENSVIEYFCTDAYSSAGDSGINIFGEGIDWNMTDEGLRDLFAPNKTTDFIMSDKDTTALSFKEFRSKENL